MKAITQEELITGFVAWLTTRYDPITISAYNSTPAVIVLLKEFLEANPMLPTLRTGITANYPDNLTMPDNGTPNADSFPLADSQDIDLLRRQVEFLYDLLDDIDTADDQAKGDDALYRKIVQAAQRKKNQCGVCSEDGITLSVDRLDFKTKTEARGE